MAVCCPFAEFLSDHRQRVLVDGAASKWIPIISVMPQGSVLGPFLFILYSSEMFKLVENRLFACADDSTLQPMFAGQQKDLLLTKTWLGFRSGAITGA